MEAVIKGLEALSAEEPSLSAADRQELAKEYATLDAEKKELSARETEINKRMQAINAKLVEIMQNEGLQKFTDKNLGKTFSLVNDFYIKEVDRSSFHEWVRANGAGDVIEERIHATRRDSMIKAHIKETGQNVPGIEATPYTKIGMRKS
jgi:hypothetical protein